MPAFLLSLLGALVVSAFAQPALAQPDDTCHARIEAVTVAVEGEARIAALSAMDARCREHPYYHYSLGKAYVVTGRFDEARAAFDAGLANPGEFAHILKLATGDIELYRHRYGRAAAIYRTVTQEYPEWHVGFEYLGFALFADGELDTARTALERSIALRESADAYRTLTLVYYLQGAFEQATDALNRGYSLNEALLGDRDFMVAGVRSYTELGRFDVARGLLAAMLKANSALKEDPEFLNAGHYLRARMVEAGLIED